MKGCCVIKVDAKVERSASQTRAEKASTAMIFSFSFSFPPPFLFIPLVLCRRAKKIPRGHDQPAASALGRALFQDCVCACVCVCVRICVNWPFSRVHIHLGRCELGLGSGVACLIQIHARQGLSLKKVQVVQTWPSSRNWRPESGVKKCLAISLPLYPSFYFSFFVAALPHLRRESQHLASSPLFQDSANSPSNQDMPRPTTAGLFQLMTSIDSRCSCRCHPLFVGMKYSAHLSVVPAAAPHSLCCSLYSVIL